ncbi:Uncharacterised protein [uncultured Blautia sp.]|nr:Uncharacterised protein [uncultured Blautia sp.]
MGRTGIVKADGMSQNAVGKGGILHANPASIAQDPAIPLGADSVKILPQDLASGVSCLHQGRAHTI